MKVVGTYQHLTLTFVWALRSDDKLLSPQSCLSLDEIADPIIGCYLWRRHDLSLTIVFFLHADSPKKTDQITTAVDKAKSKTRIVCYCNDEPL